MIYLDWRVLCSRWKAWGEVGGARVAMGEIFERNEAGQGYNFGFPIGSIAGQDVAIAGAVIAAVASSIKIDWSNPSTFINEDGEPVTGWIGGLDRSEVERSISDYLVVLGCFLTGWDGGVELANAMYALGDVAPPDGAITEFPPYNELENGRFALGVALDRIRARWR